MKNKSNIPYGRQWIDESDIEAVIKAMKSDFLTQGAILPEFEKKFAEKTGAKNAVAVSSGTAALHLAYMVAGLKPGDEIITTPITFAATANAALYLNARPVFVDIDPATGLIDADKIEAAITPKTKIIAPVHYGGLPCDMKKISETAAKHGLKVVEDACHALGAEIDGEPVGSCKYSDITVFSFHPVKHITTGEGGAVTTNSLGDHRHAADLRSHGIEKNYFVGSPDSPCYQEMFGLGNNYRLTEMQAALGLSQLKRLDMFLEKRREIAAFYRKSFKNNGSFRMQPEPEGYRHAYHLFPIIFKTNEMRDNAYRMLKDMGVSTQIHYIPVNRHLYYEKLGYDHKDTPLAYDFYRRELSIPIYPKMSENEVKYVARSVNEVAEAVE